MFPDIAPPEIQLQATYVGADAVTLEKSVATPIEQMMSGVDNMIYMYSVNANNGQMTLRVDFDINTRPNDDQILAQMRYTQAESQLPQEVRNFGVTIKKSTTSPLALFSLYSPNGTYDAKFLANYAYVNINDPMTRVPGIGQVHDLRGRAIRHALLGASGPAGQAGHHRDGDSQRHQGAEHREPGRPGRLPSRCRQDRSSPTASARRAAWRRKRNSGIS